MEHDTTYIAGSAEYEMPIPRLADVASRKVRETEGATRGPPKRDRAGRYERRAEGLGGEREGEKISGSEAGADLWARARATGQLQPARKRDETRASSHRRTTRRAKCYELELALLLLAVLALLLFLVRLLALLCRLLVRALPCSRRLKGKLTGLLTHF